MFHQVIAPLRRLSEQGRENIHAVGSCIARQFLLSQRCQARDQVELRNERLGNAGANPRRRDIRSRRGELGHVGDLRGLDG